MQETIGLQPPVAILPTAQLRRVFGMVFALAIAIGSTIGGGILHTPGDIAALLPGVPWFFAVWVLGGLNALLGATAFSELGAMMPCAGGPYVFVRRALGNYAGFFLGYVNWIQKCAVNAALALLIGEYSGALFPAISGNPAAVAFGVLIALVAISWYQVRLGGWMQSATTLVKVLGLGALVVAAFVLPHPSGGHGAAALAPLLRPTLITTLALALQSVFFSYNGYQNAVYFGEELRDPGSEIPRSMFRSLALIIALYLLLNAAFLWVIPYSQLAHDPFAGGSVARILFGTRGNLLITVTVIVSVLGTVNSGILAAPRIALDMSRDRMLPPQATHINHGGTPDVALAVSALVMFAFLFSGTFAVALQVAVSLMVVQYASMFVSVFVLRRREPDAPRPYRSWGYPWTTAVGLLVSFAFLCGVALADIRHSLIALLLLIVSYPLYRVLAALQGSTPIPRSGP